MPSFLASARRLPVFALAAALLVPGAGAQAAVAAVNLIETALASATQIPDVNERGLVVSTIAEERAKAGDWAAVDDIIGRIEDAPVRDDALTQGALIAAGKGEAERAAALVGRIVDSDGRGDASAAVASALVRQGSVSVGIALARAVEDPEQRFRALVEVARAMAGRRDPAAGRVLDDAVRLLAVIGDPGLLGRLRQTAAAAAIDMADVPRALAIADSLEEAQRRLQVLRRAALRFGQKGLRQGALTAADLVLDHLGEAPDAREQAFILLDMGTALGLAGDDGRARQAFAGAVEAVRGQTPETLDEIESMVPAAAIAGGLVGYGIEAARGRSDPMVRDIALRGAVAALADRHRLAEARAVVEEITDVQTRDAALQAVVGGAADAGDLPMALEACEAITGQQARQSAIGALAELLARSGDAEGAFRSLQRMAESPEREDVALELASIFAERGRVDAVTTAVAELQSTGNRDIGAANLALAQLAAGDLDAAYEIGRNLGEPTLRALVLARIATALGTGTLEAPPTETGASE
ncbi:hypothetical protein L2U69_10035 [Zavarzinia compransoris]|uniref:hypothetical protein n=1 Tax=Zavarzinia marina TaxID=2911065 RepID=UPI001F476ADB|nr:hypothetical protein [Zavarzinia marina]MCF4165982.1 hypothetical protein [Zavarzinia marina]